MSNLPECKSETWSSHVLMPVHQANRCPRRDTPQGWWYKKFKKKEVQNLNFCHPSKLSDTKCYQSVIHLISVEKITCDMLILRININCHQVRGMCQVWDFHIEYSEFCEKDSREHILLVQLLSLAEQWLMLNWNPKTTRWLFSFKLQAGSWELLSSIKGNKYHKWLQGCHHPVLPLPNLTYLMYHFWSRLNVSYC